MTLSAQELFLYETLRAVGKILSKAVHKDDLDEVTDDIAEALQHIPYSFWDDDEIMDEED